MFHSKASRIVLGIFVVAVGGMAIGNIEVELPAELQGLHKIEGQISSCDFGDLTRHSEKFFLGVTLSADRSPYLRMNPLIRERRGYMELCRTNAEVIITYRAKKRLIGPVRYWIIKMETVKHITPLQPTTGRDAAVLG